MEIATYRVENDVAVITMDDGKANVISPDMLLALNGALDRAEQDQLPVVLTGRAGRFSGGFDLSILTAGGAPAGKLLSGGFQLAERVLAFRTPVVVACSGHAIAMGCFLTLAADYRIGIDGPFRIQVNEVAIGMVLPHGTIELCRLRLAPHVLTRALTFAEPFSGSAAVDAGFFDQVVSADTLLDDAIATAARLGALPRGAWIGTKLRVQAAAHAAIHAGFETDARDNAESGLLG